MCLLLVLLFPALAQSAETPRLMVLALPGKALTPEEQDKVMAGLVEQARKQYRLKVLSGRAVRRAIFGTLGSGIEEASMAFEAEVEAGKHAYRNLQIGKAIRALEKARSRLAFCGPELREGGTLVDLFLFSGLAMLAQGEPAKAAGEFRLAISMNPSLQLDVSRYPPDILSTFNTAKRQLLSAPPVKVKFVSLPEGARVSLDGRQIGSTPMEAPIYLGQHFIRIEKTGYSAWTLSISGVAPDAVRALLIPAWTGAVPEDLAATAIAREELAEPVKARLRLLAGFYNVDAILMISLSREGDNIHLGQRLFVARPEIVGRARLFNLGSTDPVILRKLLGVVGTLKDLRRAQRPAVAAAQPVQPTQPAPAVQPAPPPPRVVVARPVVEPDQGVPVPGPPPPPPPEPTGYTPWYKTWWFWTLTGAVVAGTTAGILAWQLQPESSWTLKILPSQ